MWPFGGSKKTYHNATIEYDVFEEKTIRFDLYIFANGDVEEVAYCVENSYIPNRLDRVRELRDFDDNRVSEIHMQQVAYVVPVEETTANERVRKREATGWFSTEESLADWIEAKDKERHDLQVVGTGVRMR